MAPLRGHHVTGGYLHYLNFTNWEKGILNPWWQDLKPEISVFMCFILFKRWFYWHPYVSKMAEQQQPPQQDLEQLQLQQHQLQQQQSNLLRDALQLLQKKEQGIYRDLHVAAELRRMVESLAPEAARWGPLPPSVSAPAFPPAPALLLLTLPLLLLTLSLLLLTLALLLLTLPLLSGTKVR